MCAPDSSRSSLLVCLLLTGLALPAQRADAQTRSLSWNESTRVEVPGALGTILRLAGVADAGPTSQAMHVRGRVLVQEDDVSATAIDLDGGQWIAVDHDDRSYVTFTFEEMGQATAEAMSVATADVPEQARRDMEAERGELERTLEEAQATLDLRVTSESSGRRQDFGGITGTQHFIVANFEATAVPEGVEQPEGGSIVFLTELWKTSDIPSAESLQEDWARELANDPRFREMAEDMTGSMSSAGEGTAMSLAMWDPQIAAALQEISKASSELPGMTIRTTTTVATVPLGMEIDRDALIAWEPASMGDRLRGEASGAARQAVADAARGAIGRLFGGRGGGSEPAQPAAEEARPEITPFLRITTTREDLQFRQTDEDPLAALRGRIVEYQGRTLSDLMGQVR